LDICNKKPHPLIVRGIEPQHAIEDVPRFGLSIEAPQAQSIAVHTAQKGALVDQAPRKQTVKTVAELPS